MAASPKRKKRIRILLIALAVLIAIPVLLYFIYSDPKPKGVAGPEADALANKMMASVDVVAWDSLGAIRWYFGGRNKHLWDKERLFVQVSWGDKLAHVNLHNVTGLAWEGDQKVEGKAAQKLVRKAWQKWCNDSFWLNPVAKVFDPGTERKLVKLEDGSEALMITYTSGGVTPGDSYLWIVDDDGRPTAWRLWVKIIPIGGVEFSWEDWINLPGGSQVSQLHNGPMALKLTEIKAANSLQELAGKDIFAELDAMSAISPIQ